MVWLHSEGQDFFSAGQVGRCFIVLAEPWLPEEGVGITLVSNRDKLGPLLFSSPSRRVIMDSWIFLQMARV